MAMIKAKHIFPLLMLTAMVFLPMVVYADIDMTLIETIWIDDSLDVMSVTPVGDFNADGHPDLLVGVYKPTPNSHWAAYLYFGGPNFDTEPDLIFKSDGGGLGIYVCRLNDFNGDGYDDIAMSAFYHGGYSGRIFIYLGSPDPDTSFDLAIFGDRWDDLLGTNMVSGDFNGDKYSDLLTAGGAFPAQTKFMIFLGNNPPDTVCDMMYDYSGLLIDIKAICGESDLNNDGYDEYGWSYSESGYTSLIFNGAEYLSQYPTFNFENYRMIFPRGDISGDEIEDFIRVIAGQGYFLCLGGEVFDIEPDYFMWYYQSNPFMYTLNGIGPVLARDDWNANQQLQLFNIGVPFDTIPFAVFDYGQRRRTSGYNIGDINADGHEDITITFANDTLGYYYINIYSIIATDIKESENGGNLPESYDILTCYPNPFNSSTIITYSPIDKAFITEVNIFNIQGELVKRLQVANEISGQRIFIWNADDLRGNKVSSGIYFARIVENGRSFSAKLIYLK